MRSASRSPVARNTKRRAASPIARLIGFSYDTLRNRELVRTPKTAESLSRKTMDGRHFPASMRPMYWPVKPNFSPKAFWESLVRRRMAPTRWGSKASRGDPLTECRTFISQQQVQLLSSPVNKK